MRGVSDDVVGRRRGREPPRRSSSPVTHIARRTDGREHHPKRCRVQAKRVCTSIRSPCGTQFCKRFNDNRGCKELCPGNRIHACDAILADSGEVCGRTDHTRMGHNEVAHGELSRF